MAPVSRTAKREQEPTPWVFPHFRRQKYWTGDEGAQTIPDKQLAAVGGKRSSCIRVPYFGVALQCLPGTELVLTLTSGMTSVIKNDRRLRLVKPAQELQAFHFLIAWHPRMNTDPRHVWLRKALRSTVASNE